jgi:hypothetical protein
MYNVSIYMAFTPTSNNIATVMSIDGSLGLRILHALPEAITTEN